LRGTYKLMSHRTDFGVRPPFLTRDWWHTTKNKIDMYRPGAFLISSALTLWDHYTIYVIGKNWFKTVLLASDMNVIFVQRHFVFGSLSNIIWNILLKLQFNSPRSDYTIRQGNQPAVLSVERFNNQIDNRKERALKTHLPMDYPIKYEVSTLKIWNQCVSVELISNCRYPPIT